MYAAVARFNLLCRMCAERSKDSPSSPHPSVTLSPGLSRFLSPAVLAARLSLNWDCMCGNEATWHVILWSSQRTLLTANTHIPT